MRIAKTSYKLTVWLFIVMGMFFMTACQGEESPVLPEKEKPPVEKKEEFETFSSMDETFAITATTKWLKDDALHPESSLSLVSEEYNSYLIVLDQRKDDFPLEMELSYYTELVSQSLKKDLEEGQISEVKDLVVSGENAKLLQVSGTDEETPLTYQFLVVEKEESFYQVILWSSKENMEMNQAYYDEIFSSFEFKEVNTAS